MLFADAISRSFGDHDVLEDVTFAADDEVVGLVGPNGAGKTTLLRILAGLDAPDGGTAGHRGGALGYLQQEAGLDSARPLTAELWSAFPEAHAIERELEEVNAALDSGDGDLDALIERQASLFDQFDHLDGYRIEARIGRVLDGLGFEPAVRDRRCGDFSGGWQMRIALAKVLVRRPENVLLDEPTNHLDAKTREWLAEELMDYPGTVIAVTHDGEFLDLVASRIFELRERSIEAYTGNYSDYQRQKAEHLKQLDRAAARQERDIAKQEAWIDRFRSKATKAKAVQSRIKAVEKIERIERPNADREVHIALQAHGRTERDVLMLANIGHSYGENLVLLDVNLHVERGQKIAFTGPNGSGKSTLLKIIARRLSPSDGRVEWAERARPGYYDQHQDEALDPARTVIEEVRDASGGATDGQLRNVLGQFLFRGDDAFKRVAVLSGGERSRVALARFLIQPTNVLLLDEPTNHLDVTTRRKLIAALRSYDGTIICASHDPGIVDDVATHVYEVAQGGIREHLHLRRS